MKRNINLMVLVCLLIFSTCIFGTIQAQKITRVYTKTMAVSKLPSFEIINAQALDYEMHGSMSSGGDEEGYILKPGFKERPCLIIKNYRVETWSKDSVRQVVKMEVTPEEGNPKAASELLDNLQISIPQKKGNIYTIDGNLNIKKMELINGFFRRDRNTFILDDGKKYNVQQLVITSVLYLPKQSNIYLNTDYVGLHLGDLDGQLNINAKYGYLEANNVKGFNGNLQTFTANFKTVEKMVLNASYSNISALTVKHLQIGSLELLTEQNNTTDIFQNEITPKALSFSNKYRIENVNHLDISSTSGDAFTLGVVDNFKAINSNFSNYHIKSIQETFTINGKNGDVMIYKVAPGFEKINIDNQISTIELNMDEAAHFNLDIASTEKVEFRLSQNIQKGNPKTGWALNYFKGNNKNAGQIAIDCKYCEIIVN